MKKSLSVLGSTGTIGENTLSIVRAFPDKYEVHSLSAKSNVDKLREQIKEFNPKRVALLDESACELIQRDFPRLQVEAGESGISACARHEQVDVVVVGIVGFAAFRPTLAAIEAGKRIALANKETLIAGGHIFGELLKGSQAEVIPVDSEHNALFQLLEGVDRAQVASLVLTASGGPLFRIPDFPLEDVTPDMAIRHPNWTMGPKISVDCATMLNKGLEFIEAHYLFDTPADQIEIWVHPQSKVHGAIWLKDNSCMTHLSVSDMRGSIGHALAYPDRLENVVPRPTFAELQQLEFYEPDLVRFPCLRLAKEALGQGPSHIITLNAVNELAVEHFLRGELLFPQIAAKIETALERHKAHAIGTVEDIESIDSLAREGFATL